MVSGEVTVICAEIGAKHYMCRSLRLTLLIDIQHADCSLS